MKSKIILLILGVWAVQPGGVQADFTAQQQFEKFETATGKAKTDAANLFMTQLHKEHFIDSAVLFDKDMPQDSLQKKMLFHMTSYCFYALHDFESTFKYGLEAAALCQCVGDAALEGECQSMLAVAYFRKGDYVHALRHAQRDMELQRRLGSQSNLSSALNTLAGIYLATNEYNEALHYISIAIPLSTAVGDSSRMAIQMGMAAEILQAMHRSNDALDYARQAYRLDSIRNRPGKAAIRLSQMASALMDLNRNREAEAVLKRALPGLETDGNLHSRAICQNQLGELMNRRQAYAQAVDYYVEALHFFEQIGDKYNEAKARKGLYRALRKADPRGAMTHLERYVDLKDSLYSIETQHDLSLAHARYRNEELKLQNEKEREVRTLTLILGLAVVIVLLVLIGFGVYALRSRKRRLLLMRELQEEKEQFFTQITHEFRTPLTVILGLAERLKKGTLTPDETVKGVSALIERQGSALLELVNQLLDMACTQRVLSSSDYQHDDIVAYLHMVVENCQELARQKHIALSYEPEEQQVYMRFVPDYLLKIVQNLISNAVKFTPVKGEVRLSSRLTDDKKQFVIRVTDNGEGIDDELLPHIYETFTGHEGTAGEASTGVGLALVKKLVESLQGTIDVESKVGQGTCFSVTLPHETSVSSRQTEATGRKADVANSRTAAVSTEQPETASALAAPGEETGYTLLVVEDNDDIYYFMAHVLADPCYRLHHARNGEEGLEIAQSLVPDLIITDVMMPLMDGFEMCRQIKASQVTNHIPVIIVTARSTDTDRLKGLNCGADSYVYKPFSADELTTRVRNLFEQRRIWREKFMGQPLDEAVPAATVEEERPVDNLFLTKVNDYIAAHMSEGAIVVDALALHMCMSAKQLNRKLPAIVGYSVNAYIVHQRVARASHLLLTTDERVSVIAQHCGFDNPSNFTRTFRECTGVSPSVWRKTHTEGKD